MKYAKSRALFLLGAIKVKLVIRTFVKNIFMFLSIVVPTYNRANLIENTLKSILNQECEDFEVIVIDDGSTDNTEEVIRPYLSEKVHYHKIENSERGAARNRGTELANGEYVNWFDSDDEMLPNHVAALKELVDQNNKPEVVATSFMIKSENNILKATKNKFSKLQKKRKNFLIEGNYFSCNSVSVRKDVALLNPFVEDRKLSVSEDYELWLRLSAQFPFHTSSVITSYLIQHGQRSVNTMLNAQKLETRFTTFIQLVSDNKQIKEYFGKDFNYLIMKNYLLLALELANCGHKKKSVKYLKQAWKYSKSLVVKKWFYATLKHLMIK